MKSRIAVMPLLAMVILSAACSPTPATPIDPRLAIASLSEVPVGGVLYVANRDLYLADSEEAGLLALYEKDPFVGCRIAYVGGDEPPIDNSLVNFEETRFVDPCHGSEYDGSGLYLGGPSPRSMDRIPIEVVGGIVFFEPVSELVEVPRPPALED